MAAILLMSGAEIEDEVLALKFSPWWGT